MSLPNLTDEEIASLEACSSESQWNATCAEIKKVRGGKFPPDWYVKMLASGKMHSIVSKFGGDDRIRITTYGPEKD